MAANEPLDTTVDSVCNDPVQAELASLRAQVEQLTAAGHDFIGTQTRMQSLLHRATDAIIQFEADGTVSSFNIAAERTFDVAEIEVLHQPANQLFDLPVAYRDNVPGFLLEYVRTTTDQYAEPLKGRRSDGGEVLLEVSVAEIAAQDLVLFDDFSDAETAQQNDYEAFLCILHDITERKRIDEELRQHRDNLEQLVDEQTREIRAARDEAERANLAKSEFLANMSHELRTPMHAILSYSEFGQKKLHSAKLEKLGQYFERIQAAGGRLLTMINDLLDLAKAEAGRHIYDMQIGDLDAAIESILGEYSGLAEKRGVQLDLRCALDGTTIAFDAEKMGQVIRNLLSNAIKFSPEGGRVMVSTDADSEGMIGIYVRDQGPGIPVDELESVFDKFVQSSRNEKHAGGSGLGLAIARQIVLAHGGSIAAANNPDHGSCFSVRFPHRQPPEG